jgi:hypothetical protein
MLRAAIALAEAGWAVLPLAGKKPTTPHGHHDATTDPRQIRAWWREHPEYNVGSPVPASLLVLDVDPRNGGDLAELERRAGVALPPTLEVESGRRDGGRHLYYLRPFKTPYRGDVPDGIDVKTNGYMVMPPSIHPDTGKAYRWIDREIAHLPRELCALMLPRKRATSGRNGTANVGALVSTVRSAAQGQRHDTLFWAACRAHEAGVSERAFDKIIEAAEDVGMSRREAERVVESAGKSVRS